MSFADVATLPDPVSDVGFVAQWARNLARERPKVGVQFLSYLPGEAASLCSRRQAAPSQLTVPEEGKGQPFLSSLDLENSPKREVTINQNGLDGTL